MTAAARSAFRRVQARNPLGGGLPLAGGVVLALGWAVSGCQADLGECDDALARTAVWDEQGLPLYEGQALVQRSCGDGAFCHSPTATGKERFGVPRGLDFNVALASIDPNVNDAGLARLRAGQRNVYEHRQAIFEAVEAGTMPPGREGSAILTTSRTFTRQDGSPLPGIETREGQAVLKNWLACRAPVVERTSGVGMVGDVVAAMSVVVEPNFSDIHRRVLRPTCGVSNCHDGETREVGLVLDERATAYQSLVNVAAFEEGACSTAANRVVPGDPDGSLLVHKLEAQRPGGGRVCGSPMPLVGSLLRAETIESIRAWIEAGALDD